MSKLQSFLDQLSDKELAGFYTYRFNDFIKSSKETILAEISKRNLDAEYLRSNTVNGLLLDRKNEDQEYCPRCFSEKFYTSTEIETVEYSFASVENIEDYKTCLVCLYSPEKEKKKNKLPIWNSFGFLKFLMNRRT